MISYEIIINNKEAMGNLIIKISIAIFFCCTISGCIGSEKHVSINELLRDKKIYVSDLDKTNLIVKSGHGPYFFAQTNDGREIWFWYKPGFSSIIGTAEIVLAAYVDKNDVDSGSIVWPKDLVGKDYGQELERLYPRK